MFYNEDYSQKEELVSYLKKAKTDRVFILFNQILNDPVKLERELAALSNVIGFFERNGIKTGVWIFPTLGCGNPEIDYTTRRKYRLYKNKNADRRKRIRFRRQKQAVYIRLFLPYG